jgi:hypothetical protein
MVWTWHLFRGKIERQLQSPASPIPMRAPDGGPASHSLPGTKLATIETAESRSLPLLNITSKAA